MEKHYIIGLDLGQVSEFTALVVVEKHGKNGEEEKAVFHVRQLRRYEPGTGYSKILGDVVGLIESGVLESAPTLIIDGTSAGAAVIDMFRKGLRGRSVQLMAALISGGDSVTNDAEWWRIPKRDLVSAVQAVLQTRRLKIADALPEAGTLIRELEQFKTKAVISQSDAMAAWREGSNDDLVLALALGLWQGMRVRAVWRWA